MKGYVYIYAPDHPNTTKQGYVSEHRLVMEKKDDAKARGVRSPDLADALGLTFFRPVAAQKIKMHLPPMAGGWMR